MQDLGRSTQQIKNYRPRFADAELEERLRATGAVLIEGPRACGKTQTALGRARSVVRLDRDQASRNAGLLEPALLLLGEKPRLIDEWQLVPQVWNEVRGEVDDHPEILGQFILTGSSVPSDDDSRHTGALRYTRLRMRPMSLSEAGYSTGAISLAALFAGEMPPAPDPGLRINDLAVRICVGGWPALIDRPTNAALLALRGYLDDIRRADLERLDGIRRDPENVARVLRSLARHVSTEVSARALAADVGGGGEPIKAHTVLEYMNALTRVFVLEDQPAWSPALRSRGILRGSPKRHFTDPSLATAALEANPERLLRDPETLGLLFESLVVRDLRIYGQTLGASVLHYRENTGLEADAILQRSDGAWAAVEVKLGPAQIDGAAASLLRVAAHVDTKRHGEPAFLAVVTGWGYAYTRPDGVRVFPIAALAP